MATALPKPDSLRFVLPEQWVQITPDRENLDRHHQQILTNIADAGLTISKTEQRKLEVSFAQMRAGMLAHGISSLSVFADAFPSGEGVEGEDDETVIAMATCTMMSHSQETLGTHLSLRPELLATVFSLDRRPEDAVDERSRNTAIEPPEVVELPVGKVLVLKNLVEHTETIANVHKIFAQSFLIPHDETYQSLTAVQFNTPNLDLAKDFSRLFDKIATTFALLRADDPSIPGEADN